MADTEQKQTPVPFVPPSQVSPADLMKAFQDEGIVEKPAEPAPVAGKTATEPAAQPPAPAPQKTEELPALLKIAKERDAFRKEVEPLKPYMEALKVLSPTEAQRLAQARQSGDPVAALAALGFTHQQYTQKLLSLPPTPTQEEGKPEETKEAPSAEIDTIKQELAALKAEREQARIQQSRAQVLAQMKSIVKDNPKFDLINKTEDVEGIERVLIQHHQQYGTLPGSTLEESVLLAAEMYEAQLKKEAERWQKVLTGFKESAPVSTTKAPESPPSTGTVQTRTLTNANTTAPAAVRTVPKTREEIIAAIIEGRDEDLA